MKVVSFSFGAAARVDDYVYLFDEAGVEFVQYEGVTDDDKIIECCKGADAILTTVTPMDAYVIERLDPSVKCIIRIAIGYDIIDVAAATSRGIKVCNVPDYGVQEVALHACTLILSCLRKIVVYHNKVSKGEWPAVGWVYGYPIRRLSCLTVGLIGFGNIAKQLCEYLQGLGADVVAYDPYLDDAVFAERGVKRAVEMDEIFESADIISLHLPLFESTYHIINAEKFSKMKDGVIIINTARGPLIDHEALVEALNSGKVRAAGLDVFETEPFNDPEDPLCKMENVILTPHTAYESVEANIDLRRKAVEIAIAGAKGEMPYSCVNRRELVGK